MSKTLYLVLGDARTKILRQIDELKRDLTVIEDMMKRHADDTPKSIQLSSVDDDENEVMEREPKAPTEHVRILFKTFPHRKFTASQIKEHLEEKRNLGELVSNSSNLLWAANDICQRLVRQGFIRKKKYGNKVKYRLAD